LLETLYEQGVDGQLPAHDRDLGYLESAAAEASARRPARDVIARLVAAA